MHDYHAFAIQCQQEIESTSIENNLLHNFSKSLPEQQKYKLATQVHQIVWHSITHNFSFPLFYYDINNITPHNLNNIIFDLAAKLECLGIKTIGSVCDGTG